MLDKANNAVQIVREVIFIGALLLIGYMMVFKAGLPLVRYGVGSGWVPLIIGLCGFANAAHRVYLLVAKRF